MISGRCSGLMVSVLDFGSSVWVQTVAGTLRFVLEQDTLLSQLPLFTQVYKWVLANLPLGVTL